MLSFEHGHEESVSFKFDEIVDCFPLTVMLRCHLYAHVPGGVRHKLREKESIGVGNSQHSTPLNHPCLVALVDSVQSGRVRRHLHAADVDHIEATFVFNRKDSLRVHLQDVGDALVDTTLARLGPLCLPCCLFELKNVASRATK